MVTLTLPETSDILWFEIKRYATYVVGNWRTHPTVLQAQRLRRNDLYVHCRPISFKKDTWYYWGTTRSFEICLSGISSWHVHLAGGHEETSWKRSITSKLSRTNAFGQINSLSYWNFGQHRDDVWYVTKIGHETESVGPRHLVEVQTPLLYVCNSIGRAPRHRYSSLQHRRAHNWMTSRIFYGFWSGLTLIFVT
jgi:hypothetical protein